MSLDVYLTKRGVQNLPSGPKIFIREDGQTREISRAEWDAKFPDREPVTVELPSDDATCYHANITHNLVPMADKAGLYEYLWRPDEIGITEAVQLIEPLREGLARLENSPEIYRTLNPENGWGNYEGLKAFTRNYLEACQQNPDAEIEVSR